MQESAKDAATDIADLLTRFSFDLNGLDIDRLVNVWLCQYPANWVRFSLIEALYQGRYKAVSVEQILRFWHRRGRPIYHFNHEFERIIRGRFSRSLLTSSPKAALPSVSKAQPQATSLSSTARDADVKDAVNLVPPEPESSAESSADNLAEFIPSDSAIRSFSDRLKLLSSEESIAFLKLRGFENPPHPISKDLPIQAFQPIAELESEAFAQSKWVKLAVTHGPVEEIHQFVPSTAAPSEFYGKLKAVAGASDETASDGTAETADETANLPEGAAARESQQQTEREVTGEGEEAEQE
ncbi:MAG TPA: hypothetical protein V6C57_14535 [Coleofasciculaceae cyanobacterium]